MQYKTSQISYFTQLLTKISKIRFLALSFFYFLGWGGMGYGSRWVLVDKEKISFGKHKLKNRVFSPKNNLELLFSIHAKRDLIL